jgi:hypothetical protein
MTLDDRFVRWQGQTITQLTTALTLFVGFSVGELAFALSYLKESSFQPAGGYAAFFLAAMLLLSVAVICGTGAVITRLLDFRRTARKVRQRQVETSSAEIAGLGDDTRGLGKATWRLFWWLLATFTLGTLAFTVCLAGVYVPNLIRAAGL